MLEGSLENIWLMHPSLPFTEGKLRQRKKGVWPRSHSIRDRDRMWVP